MTLEDRELLRALTLAAGPPGAEDEVRALVVEQLPRQGELRHDRLGSVICELPGPQESPRVVLDAHLDEVGFMVQGVGSQALLSFVPLGGWWGHVLLGQRVDIMTAQRDRVPGVIGCKPPHFLTAGEREKVLDVKHMFIDVGAADPQEVAALGVRVGDPIVPHAEFVSLGAGNLLSCKAFDDRVGVALMCETVRAFANRPHPNTLIGVGAVQEEVGCRGAGTATEIARPDVALILEGTPADDLPGFEVRQAVLGSGPQIRFFDPSAIPNRRLLRWVESVAAELDVPLQFAVRRSGGTDASAVQRRGAGVPTVVLGVPARYIHTHVGIIDIGDYRAARHLLAGLVERLDRRVVDDLTQYEGRTNP